MPTSWPTDLAVLVPVYNHAPQVGTVVTDLRASGARVLVVDDGSTDGSGEAALAAGAEVHRLEPNQGKGAALLAGFALLSRAGFARVLTCDADGQHPLAECLRLAAEGADAHTIIIGQRDMSAAPRSSRFGRTFSNLWVRIVSGVNPGDSQSGLRIYPLAAVGRLRVLARRYHFEVEVLVKAIWAGLTLRQVPVTVCYPEDRVSHIRALEDNLRISGMFSRLFIRRMLPWPHRRIVPRRWPGWRALFTAHLSPGPGAGAAALGAAMGIAPLPGAQMLVAAWLASVFRLNVVLTLAVSNLSFGPLLAIWAALCVVTGRALRLQTGPWQTFADIRQTVAGLSGWETGTWQRIGGFYLDWVIGSLVVMPVVALVAGLIAYALLCRVRAKRRRMEPTA